jgi:hypothetical protein
MSLGYLIGPEIKKILKNKMISTSKGLRKEF